MKATIALFLVIASQSYPSLRLPVQSPSAAGRWYIEFSFSDTSKHTLRFDAEDLGKGSYLLLDTISNMVEPAQLSKAEWTQAAGSNQLTISGTIEFPIGNVGRDAGTLVFKGTFETADLIAGDVEFFRDSGNLTPTRVGTFKATRITDRSAPRVTLLSPDSGGKVRRGADVEIDWQAESGFPILVQQIFLSLDKGKNFVAITPLLDGTTTHVTWTVPDTLPTVKKALLKVMVINAAGDRAEDVSKGTFKIR